MVAYTDWLNEPMPEQGPPRPQGFKDGSLGYCQALFNQADTPEAHTSRVMYLLAEAGLPHPHSHELVVVHQNGFGFPEFMQRATKPLACPEGSAPILITPYDMAEDTAKIDEVLLTRVSVGGTILVRMLLQSEAGVAAAGRLLARLDRRLAEHRARSPRGFPVWWPLFQGILTRDQWLAFRDQLGEHLKHLAIAVNPWTMPPPELTLAVKVVQVPVGPARGVHLNGLKGGEIDLGSVKISGAPSFTDYEPRRYHLFEYLDDCRLYQNPTRIILGPTPPDWDDQENLTRVKKVTELLTRHNAGMF